MVETFTLGRYHDAALSKKIRDDNRLCLQGCKWATTTKLNSVAAEASLLKAPAFLIHGAQCGRQGSLSLDTCESELGAQKELAKLTLLTKMHYWHTGQGCAVLRRRVDQCGPRPRRLPGVGGADARRARGRAPCPDGHVERAG